MKRLLMLLGLAVFVLSSCAPKSYWETRAGKEKWKYYNKTQYGLRPEKSPKF
ncbi:MAG: hypothetical protein JST14_10240 [Bacteroidetes bacterium]|nr:hypothetical protein [Bacteroidota bacterium]MBS1978723.1 hypothetical protein [Bacteroidota bacterium]